MKTHVAGRTLAYRVFRHVPLLLLVVLPVFVYLVWRLTNVTTTVQLTRGQDIVITTLPRTGVPDPELSPIEIIGTYGDIFEPEVRGRDRAYDMVAVSATIDPLVRVEDAILWTSNLLVRSFFEYAYDDRELVESGLVSLLAQMMTTNEDYVAQLTTLPMAELTANDGYLVALCRPYYAQVPQDSKLRRQGIRWYVVLPLFNSTSASSRERTSRLRANLRTAIGRVMLDMSAGPSSNNINILALPAIAGTETLADSDNYLSYYGSFSEIMNGIRGRIVTNTTSLERIYLVSWDKLDPEEAERSINGLARLHRDHDFTATGGRYVAYVLLLIFGVVYAVGLYRDYRRQQERMSLRHFTAHYGLSILVFVSTQFISIIAFHDEMVELLTLAHRNVGAPGVIILGMAGSCIMVFLAYAFIGIRSPVRLAPTPHTPK